MWMTDPVITVCVKQEREKGESQRERKRECNLVLFCVLSLKNLQNNWKKKWVTKSLCHSTQQKTTIPHTPLFPSFHFSLHFSLLSCLWHSPMKRQQNEFLNLLVPVIVREWRTCLHSICFLVKAFHKQPSAIPFSLNTLFNPIKRDSTSQWCTRKQWEKWSCNPTCFYNA